MLSGRCTREDDDLRYVLRIFQDLSYNAEKLVNNGRVKSIGGEDLFIGQSYKRYLKKLSWLFEG